MEITRSIIDKDLDGVKQRVWPHVVGEVAKRNTQVAAWLSAAFPRALNEESVEIGFKHYAHLERFTEYDYGMYEEIPDEPGYYKGPKEMLQEALDEYLRDDGGASLQVVYSHWPNMEQETRIPEYYKMLGSDESNSLYGSRDSYKGRTLSEESHIEEELSYVRHLLHYSPHGLKFTSGEGTDSWIHLRYREEALAKFLKEKSWELPHGDEKRLQAVKELYDTIYRTVLSPPMRSLHISADVDTSDY
mgnify:FL=1